jgi:hypothetical protein
VKKVYVVTERVHRLLDRVHNNSGSVADRPGRIVSVHASREGAEEVVRGELKSNVESREIEEHDLEP